jgi:hypothetical protein
MAYQGQIGVCFAILRTIPSKIAGPAYSFDIPVTNTESQSIAEPSRENVLSPTTFKCDLCNRANSSTGVEPSNLSNHTITEVM